MREQGGWHAETDVRNQAFESMCCCAVEREQECRYQWSGIQECIVLREASVASVWRGQRLHLCAAKSNPATR